ncbi:PhnA domain-containing protein [Chitinophaga sp. B61]|uniref:PhnA domain-containing protein n=2 Tax=Chitinophaga rhizophila TaxID=2866212 RepID=A0ABS7G6U3_9BACT|nr:PhnA domain-containing protein [Chitinophaga rhizophila]
MSTTITPALQARSNGTCELCTNDDAAIAYAVSPRNNDAIENEVAICNTCLSAMEDPAAAMHWHCLAGSIWNAEPAVQALSYRLLYQHKDHEWAAEIIGSVEPDEAVVNWALSAFEVKPIHLDSNGTELLNGDTVVLTQGLNVKGANFMAPKGTIVRKIRLVADNTEQIEGKINEQTIVILTKYVRKSS